MDSDKTDKKKTWRTTKNAIIVGIVIWIIEMSALIVAPIFFPQSTNVTTSCGTAFNWTNIIIFVIINMIVVGIVAGVFGVEENNETSQ